jgi:hypothetical protein
MAPMPSAARILRYLWAAPYTALGVLLGVAAVLCGGQWRTHQGVLEFFGGRLGRAVGRAPRSLGFSAMTLGHVILAVDRSALVQLRQHERVHVRQYERWGPLFIPAYVLSSLMQLLRGRNPYRENHFERQAYAATPARRRVAGDPSRG